MGEVVHLNDKRASLVTQDADRAKARFIRHRARLGLNEPFHEDMVMLRPDPELPCDCQPVG